MDWQEVVREAHREGMEARARQPFENGGIPFRLRPYATPEHHGRDLELEGGVSDLTRHELLRVVVVFRKVKMPAALIQSDARQANMSDIAVLFGMQAGLGIEEMGREYLRILKDRFDGTMENLPPEVWKDTIITAIKGPRVLPFAICTPYHVGERGEVVYEETIERSGGVWGMLPDWWEETVN